MKPAVPFSYDGSCKTTHVLKCARLFNYNFRYITERDTVGIPEITPLDANARRGSFR